MASACRHSAPALSPAPDPLAVQREWWRAFTVADTSVLQRLTASGFRLVLSSGSALDMAGTLDETRRHVNGSRLTMDWSDEAVRYVADGRAAVVTARLRETDGPSVGHFRYITVLERAGSGWQVASAQSTRELVPTARVSASAGDLAAFAGRYRGARGGLLVFSVQDSALVSTEPNGATLRLEPVGPALFEATRASMTNGILRFSFARDTRGHVTSVSRLVLNNVLTLPRVAEP